MEFDYKKIIDYRNKEKAVIGKKYYMFDCIEFEDIKDISDYRSIQTLNDISLCLEHYCFYGDYMETYNFLYPVEEE